MEKKEVENSEGKEESISISKSTLWKIGTFVFLGLFVISLLTSGFGGFISLTGNGGTGNVVAPTPSGNVDAGVAGNIKVSVE